MAYAYLLILLYLMSCYDMSYGDISYNIIVPYKKSVVNTRIKNFDKNRYCAAEPAQYLFLYYIRYIIIPAIFQTPSSFTSDMVYSTS